MDLLHRLKAKYHHSHEKKYLKTIKRKQCNLTMAEEIILGVKLFAAILEVPQYVICEHLLQVGSYQILKALDDPEMRKILTEHLVKVHLLGNELKDDETILKLRQN